jgi:hypothetical protein
MVRPTGHDLITIMFRARHGCARLCAALPVRFASARAADLFQHLWWSSFGFDPANTDGADPLSAG